MSDRPKLTVKTSPPARDPRRRPVRGGRAPMPPRDETGPTPDRGPPGKRAGPPRQQADQRPSSAPRPNRPRPDQPAGPRRPEPRPASAPVRPERPERQDRAERTERPQRPNRPPLPAMPQGPASEGVRLSKILSDRGQASRREADDWIAAGWVRVDGRIAVLGQRVHGHERIDVDPNARQQQARSVTVLLHKPLGYVSGQAEDGNEPASVLVVPNNRWPDDRGRPWQSSFVHGLAPAGRLDLDSTGLLVLTQDGRIAKQLIGENSDIEKEYVVRVEPMREGSFLENGIQLLQHGLALDDVPLKPAKVSWANEGQLRFVLREGRKRQIRRMCELVGLKVMALRRVRIGSVSLGKLPPGQWRLLRDDERF